MSVSNIIVSGNSSSNKGALQIPKLTTSEKAALTPSNGMLIYSVDDEEIEFYNNGIWDNIAGQNTTINPNFFLYSRALAALPPNVTQKIGENNVQGNLLLFSGGNFGYNPTTKSVVCPKAGKYFVSGTMVINSLTFQNGNPVTLSIGITQNGVVQVSNYETTNVAAYPNSKSIYIGGLLSCQLNDEISIQVTFTATVPAAAEVGGGYVTGRGYLTYLNGYYISE